MPKKEDLKKLKKLPYRRCAGVMLLNKQGRVWVGRRSQKWLQEVTPNVWQMPQGGIDRGETPKKAALRELYEETGAETVEILAEYKGWLSYDLPDEALGVALRGKYRGQRQKWFVMRFLGDESEFVIDGSNGHKPEFDKWKWVKMKKLPKLIAPFKREVYEQLLKEFKHLAK
ncbi:MAG: RNA pyrophosphohydrolase [Hyphomicrobiales bacterium]|nr:MAG: RNA pyrophosphohydrolase [Hyphomicrobiales bacterium]